MNKSANSAARQERVRPLALSKRLQGVTGCILLFAISRLIALNEEISMSIQELGSLGEILAAAATVATLVYLSIQIKLNNRLAISTIEKRNRSSLLDWPEGSSLLIRNPGKKRTRSTTYPKRNKRARLPHIAQEDAPGPGFPTANGEISCTIEKGPRPDHGNRQSGLPRMGLSRTRH